MVHTKIEQVLGKYIAGNEELEGLEGKFHAIESEIDTLANKTDADMDKVFGRAKELMYRTFVGQRNWLDSKWHDIKEDIEENIKASKR